jgi:hypothetical protein
MADQADARQERQGRQREMNGEQHTVRPQSGPEEMSEIMRKWMAQQGEDHGTE